MEMAELRRSLKVLLELVDVAKRRGTIRVLTLGRCECASRMLWTTTEKCTLLLTKKGLVESVEIRDGAYPGEVEFEERKTKPSMRLVEHYNLTKGLLGKKLVVLKA